MTGRYSYTDEQLETPPHKGWLEKYGALVVAAITLSLNLIDRNAPRWLVGLTILVLSGVVVMQAIPFVKMALRWSRRRSAESRIHETYLPRIAEVVNSLLPLLDESRSDTVLHVWKNNQSTQVASIQKAGQFTQPPPIVSPAISHHRAIKSWLERISSRIPSCKKSQFQALAGEVGDALCSYHYLCEEAFHQLDALSRNLPMQPDKLRSLKQESNLVREKHNKMMDAWTEIAKAVNAAFGDRICIDYYLPLKTIV